jgi:hypothetical protein
MECNIRVSVKHASVHGNTAVIELIKLKLFPSTSREADQMFNPCLAVDLWLSDGVHLPLQCPASFAVFDICALQIRTRVFILTCLCIWPGVSPYNSGT